jgi:hypothetical protein
MGNEAAKPREKRLRHWFLDGSHLIYFSEPVPCPSLECGKREALHWHLIQHFRNGERLCTNCYYEKYHPADLKKEPAEEQNAGFVGSDY